MSLATRCAACGTVFRVVQDQLKVSEGWVRCGRCGDVFNALEGLFDLERETAPAWTPSQRGELDLLPVHGDERKPASVAAGEPAHVMEREGDEPGHIDNTELDTRSDSHLETHLMPRDDRDPDDDDVGRGELSDLGGLPSDDPPAVPPTPAPTPAFMRRAETAARWQRPGMRRGLALAAVLLGVLLAAQAVLWQRDVIAARWPQFAPLLAAACETLGCRIEPFRRLDGLVVESSGLTQLDAASQYRFQVALRNRDAWPLLMPALDVTLTDNRGEVVARRVLRQSDFGTNLLPTVAAGAELTLQVVFDAGDRRISGYSVEIFYP